MPHRLTGLLAAAACFFAAAATAHAHGETSPLIRGVVDGMTPRVDGVNVVPISGTASLLNVVNTTGEDLEVLDPEGKPFLRVGPRGAYGNRASPYWWQSGNADGVAAPGAPRTVGREPRWSLVSRRPAWAYYEHRLHPRQVELPPEARGARRVIRLLGFEVGMRHGGRPMELTGHLEFRPVLGSVRPAITAGPQPLPGVSVAVLDGRFPGMLLRNGSRRTVHVEGVAGEPFARVGPRGTAVNLRSPTWVEDRRARGQQIGVAADAGAAPLWRKVSPAATFAWLEARARYAPGQPPDAVAARTEPTVLKRWTIPVRAGDRRAAVRGETSWLPSGPSGLPLAAARAPDGGAPSAWWAVLALPALLVLRRARRLRRPSPR